LEGTEACSPMKARRAHQPGTTSSMNFSNNP
jgi:hypothetical protein